MSETYLQSHHVQGCIYSKHIDVDSIDFKHFYDDLYDNNVPVIILLVCRRESWLISSTQHHRKLQKDALYHLAAFGYHCFVPLAFDK